MHAQRESLLCHYRYDAMDRLIGSELTTQTELQRFYCKSRLATEIQGLVQRSIFQQGDQLLAQQQRQHSQFDTMLLSTDQQRSVLHTLRENSPRQAIAYPPYGHHRAESGLTSLLGFNGERPDPVTGHYILGNGYRAFNPVLMRFNSPDSLSPFGKGGLNPYAYCSGDPVNFSDPTGNASILNHLFNRIGNALGRDPTFVIDGSKYESVGQLWGRMPYSQIKKAYKDTLKLNKDIADRKRAIVKTIHKNSDEKLSKFDDYRRKTIGDSEVDRYNQEVNQFFERLEGTSSKGKSSLGSVDHFNVDNDLIRIKNEHKNSYVSTLARYTLKQFNTDQTIKNLRFSKSSHMSGSFSLKVKDLRKS